MIYTGQNRDQSKAERRRQIWRAEAYRSGRSVFRSCVKGKTLGQGWGAAEPPVSLTQRRPTARRTYAFPTHRDVVCASASHHSLCVHAASVVYVSDGSPL
uniref:Uncharacterized protein n=1 Tax=Plectus sambesii TaxID=2011161 RepID=A0A914X3C2_9BILA